MNLKSLAFKTLSGDKYILAQPTMMFRNRDVVPIIATHIVKEDEVGRPDLIALEYYNDDSRTDIILKWNGISCLLYTSPSPRDGLLSRMPSSA